MYEEKIPFKRLGTVEEGYGQERQAAGKQIQILNTGNQTVTVKAVSAEGYVVGIPEGSITISDMTWNKWLNQITFGKFFNKTQKVEITAHDTGTGIANIVYYVAEGEQSVEQLNALPNGKWNLYRKQAAQIQLSFKAGATLIRQGESSNRCAKSSPATCSIF